MPQRSQRHKEAIQGGSPPPPITGLLPDTATIAAIGAVGRTVATLSTQGGTSPFTYLVTAAGGLSAAMTGNLLKTTVDPCGTAGVKTVTIQSTDARNQTKSETIAVTVT